MIVSGKTEPHSITHTLTHPSITGPFSHVNEVKLYLTLCIVISIYLY